MENKDTNLEEMRQQMKQLQSDIDRHSTFHSDIWRRTTAMHVKQLNRWTRRSIIACIVIFPTLSLLLWRVNGWPWWLALAFFLAFAALVVDALMIMRGHWRVDTRSRAGLMSIKEHMDSNSRGAKVRKIVYPTVGAVLMVAIMARTVRFDGIGELISLLVTVAITGVLVRFTVTRPLQKRMLHVQEEVDALLDEEESTTESE